MWWVLVRTIPEMMTTKIHPNLIREQMTSISPNQLTAPGICVSLQILGVPLIETPTDIDQNDDNPKDSHPRGDRHGISPEHQNSIDSLKLVRDRDEVVEPVGPTDSETSSRIDEFVRPLHEGGWQRVPKINLQHRSDQARIAKQLTSQPSRRYSATLSRSWYPTTSIPRKSQPGLQKPDSYPSQARDPYQWTNQGRSW